MIVLVFLLAVCHAKTFCVEILCGGQFVMPTGVKSGDTVLVGWMDFC